MSIGTYLRSLSYVLALLVIGLVCIIPALLVASLPERWRFHVYPYYWLEYACYWLMIKSWWVPVTFIGRENIPNESAIYAANHQSSIDIPLLGILPKTNARVWLMWDELAKYPIFGYVASRMNVLINPTSPLKAARSLFKAVTLSTKMEHLDIMIFPEGGRFTDGQTHAFFAGFAMLALKTMRPVVPVMIKNSAAVCFPHTAWIHYAPITVIIGKPMKMQEDETEQAFSDRVHAWFNLNKI